MMTEKLQWAELEQAEAQDYSPLVAKTVKQEDLVSTALIRSDRPTNLFECAAVVHLSAGAIDKGTGNNISR